MSEETPLAPVSPYGRSKLMVEWMLEDAARAYDFRYVALRYFNVAGADPQGRLGQSTPNATHLIKRGVQTNRQKRRHVGGIARPHLGADRPAVAVDDEAEDHLLQPYFISARRSWAPEKSTLPASGSTLSSLTTPSTTSIE